MTALNMNIPYLFIPKTRATDPGTAPFDPTRDEKYWADPSPTVDANGNVTYQMIADDWSGFTSVTMPKNIAMTPNYPGHDDYPAAPPQLNAVLNGSTIIPVVSLAAAQAFAKQFGADPSTITDTLASIQSFSIVYPNNGVDPTIRAWEITFGGVQVQVAFLIQQMNANGVGSPGKWNGTTWVSTLASPDASSPVMGVPVDMSKVPAGSTLIAPNLENGAGTIELPGQPVVVGAAGGGTDPNTPAILVGVNKLLAFFRIS